MKIAYKKSGFAQAVVIGCCLLAGPFIVSTSFAADPATPTTDASPSLPKPPALQVPSAAPPSNPTASVASMENALPIPSSPKSGKVVDALDIKVPDSVKDAIKKLDATENVTLEDLNEARQAIAKIDALIEIEKRLTELDKLRQEHEGASVKPLAAAIPASALNALPPPSLPQFTQPPSLPQNSQHPQLPTGFGGGSSEISRIIGTGGRYAALVKNGDQTKTIQVGDHFDGATVISISATGVQLEDGKTTRTVHVKNVDNIFGDTN